MDDIQMHVIARMKSDFPAKFGIPRQSAIVNELSSTIIFEPDYRNPDSLRGLEDFSHLWIIWQFSKAVRSEWSPTVRPPRLGGNTRLGDFATRSPFRPIAIGVSSVKINGLERTKDYGTVIHVAGADLMDGTPILDIKPYIPYGDCHPDATGGFTETAESFELDVVFPEELQNEIPQEKLFALRAVLSHDPRPSYQRDNDRIYGLSFAGMDIHFKIKDQTLIVCDVQKGY